MSQLPSQIGQIPGAPAPVQQVPSGQPTMPYIAPAPQPQPQVPVYPQQAAPQPPAFYPQQPQQPQPGQVPQAPAGEEPLWNAAAIRALMMTEGGKPPASIRDELAKRGLPVDQQMDDSAAMDFLVQRAQQAQQMEQFLLAQQFQARQQAAQQGQPQQPQQPQQGQPGQAQPQNGPGPQQPAPYWDKGPEWDTKLEQFLTTDASGTVKIAPNFAGVVDPTLPQKYLARKQWEREAAQRLLQDPAAVVWGGLQDPVSKLVDQAIDRRLQRQREQETAQAFTVDNEQWLFDHDQAGNRILNPIDGNPKLSQAGQVFGVLVNQLQASGIQDGTKAIQLAMMSLPGALAQLGINIGQPQPDPQQLQGMQPMQQYPQQYPQPQPQPQFYPQQPFPQAAPPTPQGFVDFGRQQQNEQFLRASELAALHQPGRGGSLAAAGMPGGPPQNTETLDPKAVMEQLARQNGLM